MTAIEQPLPASVAKFIIGNFPDCFLTFEGKQGGRDCTLKASSGTVFIEIKWIGLNCSGTFSRYPGKTIPLPTYPEANDLIGRCFAFAE